LIFIRDHYPVLWVEPYKPMYYHFGILRINHYRHISWEANRKTCEKEFQEINDVRILTIWKDRPDNYPDDYSFVENSNTQTPISREEFEKNTLKDENGYWVVQSQPRGYSSRPLFRLPAVPIRLAVLSLWIFQPRAKLSDIRGEPSAFVGILIHQQYTLTETRTGKD